MNPEVNINIEKTADGSVTLYREDIDEHYHSVKGALAESLHVYLDLGWRHAASLTGKLRVFEVGFGTGLNAAITATEALHNNVKTDYFSVELNPLSYKLTDLFATTVPNEFADSLRLVNNASWNRSEEINSCFSLTKIHGDLLEIELPTNLDVVYFDAFAPEKQPELWEADVFRRIFNAMSDNGVLTTYCAKGAVRRLLQETGFTVERLPGPPQGKREVLRATKIAHNGNNMQSQNGTGVSKQ